MRNAERLKPVVEAATNAFTLFLLASLLFAGFSYDVRVEIRKRDGSCRGCKKNHPKLEAAHFNHDKRYNKYNDPENGRALCPRCHYLDHYENKGRNGLTRQANDWALNRIWERLTKEDKEGLPEPPPDPENTKRSWQQGKFIYG